MYINRGLKLKFKYALRKKIVEQQFWGKRINLLLAMFNEETVATTLTINVKYDLQNLTMKFDRRLELRMTIFTFTV